MPSRVIRSFRYTPERRELEVRFATGRRYLFHDVPPRAASAFSAAFSKGRHFNANIRGRYRFTELAPAASDAHSAPVQIRSDNRET